jgi:hypothetical protein
MLLHATSSLGGTVHVARRCLSADAWQELCNFAGKEIE